MKFWRWFYPGMGIKRWLFLVLLGLIIFSHGLLLLGNLRLENYTSSLDAYTYAIYSYTNHVFAWAVMNKISIPFLYTLMIAGGLFIASFGIWGWMHSIVKAVTPGSSFSLVDMVYQKRSLNRGLKIVAIGGGTGLSTLLRGLKEYTNNIVAVVTVADDGGSSGRLRKELGVIPPGDIRNCIVALADSELLEELLQYRFEEGQGLEGHSFGNLFLVAMTGISGDFVKAVKALSGVLAIRGKVLPSSAQALTLCAELEDGTLIEGESTISQKGRFIKRLFCKPHKPAPLLEVLQAIKEADAVILGPGSLYTSIMPNLLVNKMTEAIRNSQAVKIFVCNCMTQPGETEQFKTASSHITALERQFGPGLIQYALVNTASPGPRLLAKYRQAGSEFVVADLKEVEALGVTPVALPLLSESEVVRHDFKRLGEAVMKVMMQGFSSNIRPSGYSPAVDREILTDPPA